MQWLLNRTDDVYALQTTDKTRILKWASGLQFEQKTPVGSSRTRSFKQVPEHIRRKGK